MVLAHAKALAGVVITSSGAVVIQDPLLRIFGESNIPARTVRFGYETVNIEHVADGKLGPVDCETREYQKSGNRPSYARALRRAPSFAPAFAWDGGMDGTRKDFVHLTEKLHLVSFKLRG